MIWISFSLLSSSSLCSSSDYACPRRLCVCNLLHSGCGSRDTVTPTRAYRKTEKPPLPEWLPCFRTESLPARFAPLAIVAAAIAAALFTRPGLVDVHRTSVEFSAVERGNRIVRFVISTKPKPRGWPVSRSVTTLTRSTEPYAAKAASGSFCRV